MDPDRQTANPILPPPWHRTNIEADRHGLQISGSISIE
jgi:hypothetical protein